jgi:hypothetical protein
LKEEQYLQVCESCDNLLLAADSTLERVAIPWLHVLNEHPANLAQYASLFNPTRPAFLGIFRRVVRSLWSMRAWLRRGQTWHGPDLVPSRVEVVIVSHLLNESQVGEAEDFYFGKLPEALARKGFSTVVALLDHTGLNLQTLARRWPSGMAPRLLFSATLGWLDELKLRGRLRREAGRLRSPGKDTMPVLHKRVREIAAVQALAPSTIATLRLYVQVQNMVAHWRPVSIVVTYEGHAWERLVFAAARSVNPSIRCVGYHHAILFPRQHAIKRPLGREYDPDIICMGGGITRKVLEQTTQLHDTPLVTVGTHRQEESGLSLLEKKNADLAQACLVIPDGTVDECLTIFGFVLEAAVLAPHINFIIRMHPVMPFAVVAARDPRLLALPANVRVSDQPIKVDFDRSRWAIYRGSGAAIRAVVAGLRPFYLKPCGEKFGIDPLYELDTWRYIVTSPEELMARIELDLASNVEDFAEELAKAREFCGEYFTPVNLEKFCQYIVNGRA